PCVGGVYGYPQDYPRFVLPWVYDLIPGDRVGGVFDKRYLRVRQDIHVRVELREAVADLPRRYPIRSAKDLIWLLELQVSRQSVVAAIRVVLRPEVEDDGRVPQWLL